jgi:hypothetical protein
MALIQNLGLVIARGVPKTIKTNLMNRYKQLKMTAKKSEKKCVLQR